MFIHKMLVLQKLNFYSKDCNRYNFFEKVPRRISFGNIVTSPTKNKKENIGIYPGIYIQHFLNILNIRRANDHPGHYFLL